MEEQPSYLEQVISYVRGDSDVKPAYHSMHYINRPLPKCGHCQRALTERLAKCSCGVELHIRCIRLHKRENKV